MKKSKLLTFLMALSLVGATAFVTGCDLTAFVTGGDLFESTTESSSSSSSESSSPIDDNSSSTKGDSSSEEKETYTVTLPTGEGYSVTGATSVTEGEDYEFTVTVSAGYDGAAMTVKVNGTAVTATEGKYVVENVAENLTVTVEGLTAIVNTYAVTIPTGEGYTISGSTTAAEGYDYEFTVSISAGYKAPNLVVKVNGTAVTATEGKYVVKNVTADITITVEGVEALATYNVTIPTCEGYTVTGEASVTEGRTYEFTVAVSDGYDGSALAVKVNEETVTATEGKYVVENVSADIVITVEGVAKIHNITVNAGALSVNGTGTVVNGNDYQFTVAAPIGETLKADGAEVVGEPAANGDNAVWTFKVANVTEAKAVTISEWYTVSFVATEGASAFTVTDAQGNALTDNKAEVAKGDEVSYAFKITVEDSTRYAKVSIGEDIFTTINGVFTTPYITGAMTINVETPKGVAYVGANKTYQIENSVFEGYTSVALKIKIDDVSAISGAVYYGDNSAAQAWAIDKNAFTSSAGAIEVDSVNGYSWLYYDATLLGENDFFIYNISDKDVVVREMVLGNDKVIPKGNSSIVIASAEELANAASLSFKMKASGYNMYFGDGTNWDKGGFGSGELSQATDEDGYYTVTIADVSKLKTNFVINNQGQGAIVIKDVVITEKDPNAVEYNTIGRNGDAGTIATQAELEGKTSITLKAKFSEAEPNNAVYLSGLSGSNYGGIGITELQYTGDPDDNGFYTVVITYTGVTADFTGLNAANNADFYYYVVSIDGEAAPSVEYSTIESGATVAISTQAELTGKTSITLKVKFSSTPDNAVYFSGLSGSSCGGIGSGELATFGEADANGFYTVTITYTGVTEDFKGYNAASAEFQYYVVSIDGEAPSVEANSINRNGAAGTIATQAELEGKTSITLKAKFSEAEPNNAVYLSGLSGNNYGGIGITELQYTGEPDTNGFYTITITYTGVTGDLVGNNAAGNADFQYYVVSIA